MRLIILIILISSISLAQEERKKKWPWEVYFQNNSKEEMLILSYDQMVKSCEWMTPPALQPPKEINSLNKPLRTNCGSPVLLCKLEHGPKGNKKLEEFQIIVGCADFSVTIPSEMAKNRMVEKARQTCEDIKFFSYEAMKTYGRCWPEKTVLVREIPLPVGPVMNSLIPADRKNR